MARQPCSLLAPALSLCLITACSSTGPDGLDLGGEWSGVSTLPNPFTTSASLSQTGTAVSGTLRVAGSFVQGRPVTGQVSEANRTFTWAVGNGCELWGGVLTIDAGGDAMSGPVLVNRSGCSGSPSNSSGQMQLTRQ
jgi:hypothetical protein